MSIPIFQVMNGQFLHHLGTTDIAVLHSSKQCDMFGREKWWETEKQLPHKMYRAVKDMNSEKYVQHLYQWEA